MTDDHALARDLAGQAGTRLLELRAQGGEPEEEEAVEGVPEAPEALAESADAGDRRSDEEQAG